MSQFRLPRYESLANLIGSTVAALDNSAMSGCGKDTFLQPIERLEVNVEKL
jgi:hypothetical protein